MWSWSAWADRSELTEQATTSILRELVAGLRFLTSRSPEDEAQYATLVAEAESFRRNALSVGMLRADERRRLEVIGTLKAAMEVRIAVTHAWQTIGNEANAQRVLQQTNREMQAIEAELQALRRAARSSADDSMERMRDELWRAELLLALVVAAAFGVAAFFGLSTARAVSDPLVPLREEMMAIGAGDLRDPGVDLRTRGVAREYADLIDAMQQARARLRLLLLPRAN